VVSTGGGAFCCPDNRRLIRASGGTAIYLDVPWAVIRERLGTVDSTRPKWTGGSDARQLFEDRCADYLQAPIRIRLDGGEDPDEVAGRITAALAELACAS
jgi:shikimate kinase